MVDLYKRRNLVKVFAFITTNLGSFGVVYLCQDKVTKEHIALKVEKENADMMSLEREIQIIEELRGVNGIINYIKEAFQNYIGMELNRTKTAWLCNF